MTKHYRRGALAAAATLLLAFAATADPAAEKSKDKEDRADAEQVQQGKQLYAAHCSHCHGFNMITAGNVTYDLREFPGDQRERFFESVTNGRNNRMPPWGDSLTQDEIGEIWVYVRTRGRS
jgi:mono/diheme cytochrome c family protein